MINITIRIAQLRKIGLNFDYESAHEFFRHLNFVFSKSMNLNFVFFKIDEFGYLD